MGYFDTILNVYFKIDDSGNTLFYPWGVLGSGFILDSEDQKNQIRESFKKMFMVILPATIIMPLIVGFWIDLVLIPIQCFWYYSTVKKITKGSRKTDIKLKVSETYRHSAKAYNLPTLIFLELISLGFVVNGIWLLTISEETLVAYLSIGFFGICSGIHAYMIFTKIKDT